MIKALIFLAAGVAVGLLLAPESGKEFRTKILNGFDDALDGTKDIFKENFDAGKSKAKSVVQDSFKGTDS